MSNKNSNMKWISVGAVTELPKPGARIVRHDGGNIAVFRTSDDKIYALENRCPHKGGPLSEGIVHGCKVTCPLHNWVIDLDTGTAVAFFLRDEDAKMRKTLHARFLVSQKKAQVDPWNANDGHFEFVRHPRAPAHFFQFNAKTRGILRSEAAPFRADAGFDGP